MELEKLIDRLQILITGAKVAYESGDTKMVRECLKQAKDLLDAEFLKD
ncbi:unnamed protein product [marine sediment metagenome]|uniref:Uncharacterized protein n=1 Tax=marine sediment metagenome TaxID=412755 RepID=X1TV89_9ZZZZ